MTMSLGNGVLLTNIGYRDVVTSLSIQSDGKILVAGSVELTSGAKSQVFVARYNSDGSIDKTFGDAGKFLSQIVTQGSALLDIALSSSGAIYGAGYSSTVPYTNLTAIKINANGLYENSFGTSGKVITNLSSASDGRSIAIQADGKVLVGGYFSNSSGSDYVITRYSSTGVIDPTFGTNGITYINYGTWDYFKKLSLQTDGKILLTGYLASGTTSENDYSITRLLSNGQVDTTFGVSGKTVTDFNGGFDEPSKILTQADGKILVFGSTYIAGTDYDNLDSMGMPLGERNFALARYNLNGTLDTSFGQSGKFVYDFGGTADWGVNATLQSDGKILLAGWLTKNGQLLWDGIGFSVGVIRVNSSGLIDTTFGVNGQVKAAIVGGDVNNLGISLQADGKIIIGATSKQSGENHLALLRYTSNGTLDSTFAPAPTANSITANATEDIAVTGTLTATAMADKTLTYSKVANPTSGTVVVNTNGTYTYTPNANFNGNDSFTFKANDGASDSATATVSITVTAVNDAPVATAVSISTNEDTAKTGTLTATDVDSSTLTYSKVAGPTNGAVAVSSNGAYTYTPNANFNGTDSFTFKANDGALDSAAATVSITVTAVNDAPVATAASITTNEDTTKSGTLTATDIDSTSLTYSKVANPSNGTVTVNSNGTYTYTPNANFNGTDSFTFKANDGAADSAAATVSITVSAVNDSPVGTIDITGTAKQGETLTATKNFTDVDGIPPIGVGSGNIKTSWLADGVTITGTTAMLDRSSNFLGATLELTADHIGKKLSFTATYTDNGGTQETVTST
jgi:uncharacterized delta-60 repeat protein